MSYILVIGGRRREFTTVEKIEKTMRACLDEEDRRVLAAAERIGATVYAAVNPYDAEMCSEDGSLPGVLLASTQENLDQAVGNARENI